LEAVRLTVAEFDLLRNTLRNNTELSGLVARCTRVLIYLNDSQKESICDTIGDELANHGGDSNGGINEKGMTLDDLLGKFIPY